MTASQENLPPARTPKPLEERIRILDEELPKLRVGGESACRRVSVTVGHERRLLDVRLAWDALADEFELVRGPRNEPLGHVALARIVETAVHAAMGGYGQAVVDAMHESKPKSASLENQYYDEYWDLPEWERPDSVDEYIRQRKAEQGGPVKPEDQFRADEKAAAERIKAEVGELSDLNPDKLRVTESWMTNEAAESRERYAEVVRQLQAFDPSTVQGVGKDDPHNPQVTVTVSMASAFALELGERVWSAPGSRLGEAVVRAAAAARADFAEKMAQGGLTFWKDRESAER
ncbi:MAG: hypothetical protein ACRC20_13755 [Segniliparus sp.]|uniref:hypothetical protein n=1 Tax=Segniliparus sp. TaxID=2804064 RepID=UPI003F2F3E07